MKTRLKRILILLILLSALFGTLCASAIIYTEEDGMKFDGLFEYKTASVDMQLPATYEATVRFPADFNGSGGVAFGNYSDDKTAGFKIEICEGGSPRIYIIDAAGAKYDVTFDGVNVYTGNTTHIAISLDRAAGAWLCYVNGELAASKSAALPEEIDLTAIFALGGDNLPGNSDYFKGELFSLALYSDTRDANEIATDARGESVDTDGLIAAYTELHKEGENIAAIGDSKYDLIYKCEWIKDVDMPEDYAYSFAVIGDIQSMTYYYPEKLINQYEWIRDNAENNKMAFCIGLGDITEKNTAAEYLTVIEAYEKIDGVVPFSIIRGNHERTSSNSTAMYDSYITQDRYGDEITGSLDDTMHNTYRILQVGKVKYMFMNLDLVLSDEAIDWANEIIAAHPECHVVVSTHSYKNMSGTYLAYASDGNKYGVQNDSVVLWDRLLSQHENIVLMLYGHSPKDTIYRKQREGVNGNIVTEMLINPSELDKAYGGGGFVTMFYFSEDGTTLDVRHYSTAKQAYFKSQNQFTLELDTPGTVEFTNLIMNVGSDESERNLTWYTQYDAEGEVQYAISTDGSFPDSFSTARATAVKATKSGYYSYKATMTGLKENSTYVYRLVVGGMVSECYTFNTYSMSDEFSFAFITDPQLKESSHSLLWEDTLNKLKEDFGNISIVVSGGDQTSDASLEENFDWFTSSILSSIAIATTVGPPHDNTPLYNDHFNLPNLSSTYGISTPSSDYFYTYNNVLFMHLNVENHDYAGHTKFMENAIADNPDCIWRVVVLHYSFFSGGNHSTDASVLNFRSEMAGKFTSLGVDLVLSGHDHVYTRSELMLDGSTVSGDTIAGGAVTNPLGTLYICGTSSTGSGWYNVEHHDDDAYIAFTEDTNRKSVVIFSVTETSLTLKAYFIDGNTPEEFDLFTINKTQSEVRLNGKTDMLEILIGDERTALINAYNYSSAIVKTVGGYWALSTDGGVSFESLGIPSADASHVLRINPTTGVWELSVDGGEAFESLGINARAYTVKYITLPGAAFGDTTDISDYSARRFTATSPDAPALWMPKGSMAEGKLYSWSWEYYLEGGDGTPVTSFAFGESYIAYPVASESPISSIIYVSGVSGVSAPQEYTYTWSEAWDIVSRCAGERITLILKSDITLTDSDAISVVIPVDLTLDLGGYVLNTSALAPAVKFAVGSGGSDFTVISSAAGGKLNAGSNDFLEIGTNQGSTISIHFGTVEAQHLTVESVRYLVGANGNFKYTSTLNLSVIGGSYTVTRGIVYVSNVKAGASFNIYNVTLKDASFNFLGSESAIVRAKSTTGYGTRESSYINAVGCVFTDTYKSAHNSSRAIIHADCWYGTLTFTDCDFIGMSIGTTYAGAALENCGTVTVNEGCSFTNSATTFTKSNPISFAHDKVTLGEGCVIARTDKNGSVEILKSSDAVEITWENPVGYTDVWKRGVTPAYLGESSFSVGENVYSLVLAEAPSAANENKSYAFVSAEGYLYRYNSEREVWQISTNGGDSYLDITEDGVTEEPTPEPNVGCTVTIEGVSTTFPEGTDFAEVFAFFYTDANKNKEVHIVLGTDMTLTSTVSLQKKITVRIDLAGHKLTFGMSGRFKTGNEYVLQFYSSTEGGELYFGNSGDGIQPGKGTVIFGSEEYKNTLTVNTKKEILNMTYSSSGSWLDYKFLYCTVNVGSNGLIRMNAKGAGSVTVRMDMIGCTFNSTTPIVAYNYTETLNANTNGGVFTTSSYIRATDTEFISTSSNSVTFFGSVNFTDRYYGTVSFEGCTFDGFVLNAELLYSDEVLSYNDYYSTLTDYDPTKTVTVGKGCVFYNCGSTFNEGITAFSAINASVREGCVINVEGDAVCIVSNDYGCSVTADGVTTYYPASTDFRDILSALNSSDYSGKEINIVLNADMTLGTTITFSSAKNYTMTIDLAGHTLTLDAGGRLRFGGVFALTIYSSKADGMLVCQTKDDCIQLDTSGVLVLGSEDYKNNLTVNAVTDLINVSQLANGSTLGIRYLYTAVNAGSNGLVRLNAKGAGAVTLNAEVIGCTVISSSKIFGYNTSSTVGATSNGGVYTRDSYIIVKDSTFTSLSEDPVIFFGTGNFRDRFFGSVSFESSIFTGYVINGEAIYSDEALSYNTYYDTLAGTGYNPNNAVTVGKDCVFYSFGSTFNGAVNDFSATNTSISPGTAIVYTDECVMILDSTEHVLSDWIFEDGQHWLICTSCADGVRFNLSDCDMEESGSTAVCTVCGRTEYRTPTILGAQVNISANLAIKFHVLIPEGYDPGEIIIRITNAHGTVVELNGELLKDNTYLFIYGGIAPQCMSDEIDAELIYRGSVIDSAMGYSIVKNAKNLAAKDSATPELKQLLADLLAYGKSAQEHVGASHSASYVTDEDIAAIGSASLLEPDESINLTDRVLGTPTDVNKAYISEAGVRFDNEIHIFVGIKGTDATRATVLVNGVEYMVTGEKLYLPGMSITDISSPLIIELYLDGECVHTVTYGVYAYVYQMITNDPASTMAGLAKALYNYAESARAYVESIS